MVRGMPPKKILATDRPIIAGDDGGDFISKSWIKIPDIHKKTKKEILESEALHYLAGSHTGVPFDIPYFQRFRQFTASPTRSEKTVVIERPDYDVSGTRTYPYQRLATDMWTTRKRIIELFRKEVEEMGGRKGRTFGLIADRSYEFVVNLLALLSIGIRPAFIPPNSRPPEVLHMMTTTFAEHIVLSKNPSNQTFLEDPMFKKGYKTFNNDTIGTADLLTLTELGQYYKNGQENSAQGTVLFTSGTTGNPKAVFSTIRAVSSQCASISNSWKYSSKDHILHALPTHHIHGLVNTIMAPISSGTSIEFIGQNFNALKVLERIARPPSPEFPQVTMFHGVPTMYSAFVSAYDSLPLDKQSEIQDGLRRLRVAVCGSAALPTSVALKWKEITGAIPLERYGMTETGMVFSNSLDPEKRILGSVGYPMDDLVVARIMDQNQVIIPLNNAPGDLILHWNNRRIFTRYWNNRTSTNKANCTPTEVEPQFFGGLTDDGKVIMVRSRKKGARRSKKAREGWFKTGDVAMRGDNGEWYILGRYSVDVIKVAGHKVSTLEIEREILSVVPEVAEVAVVGAPSVRFGRIPQAIIALKEEFREEHMASPEAKRAFVKTARRKIAAVLSSEKLPRRWILVDKIPRNLMGKVNKKELLENQEWFPSRREDPKNPRSLDEVGAGIEEGIDDLLDAESIAALESREADKLEGIDNIIEIGEEEDEDGSENQETKI
ncbi:hypothetical protein ABW19_dt0203131 [Dactylella cylindrospora]|nr:hypothetical protein ABW19_dt0203131 [Dactylella cylindrospora]